MDDLICIGYIARIKGKDASLEISSSEYGHIKLVAKPKYIFLENSSTLVPYTISSISAKDKLINVALEGIEKTEIYTLKSLRAFLHASDVKIDNPYSGILGYKVFNGATYLGEIIHIEQSSRQELILVKMPNSNELPIPYNQITLLDHNNKEAQVILQDDFIEIFANPVKS
jgi:ribosomal 30S subunit maturation factor RimM